MLKEEETGEINFKFYLTPYIQDITTSTHNQHKND